MQSRAVSATLVNLQPTCSGTKNKYLLTYPTEILCLWVLQQEMIHVLEPALPLLLSSARLFPPPKSLIWDLDGLAVFLEYILPKPEPSLVVLGQAGDPRRRNQNSCCRPFTLEPGEMQA